MSLHKLTNDISGIKFGKLTAKAYSHSKNGAFWVFICECGNEKILRSSFVVGGHQISCGCMSVNNRFSGTGISSGQIFGYVTAIKKAGKKGHNLLWDCICKCGNEFQTIASNLLSGNTKSCGCLKKEVSEKINTKHGMSNTPIYRLWHNMMRRCYETKNPAYPSYGGRGIYVCESWKIFENFYADMGHRPINKSLDRIDNNAGYSPENCRWATKKEQARNTRSNRFIDFEGKKVVVSEFSEKTGIPASRIYARLRSGLEGDLLINPSRNRKTRSSNNGHR